MPDSYDLNTLFNIQKKYVSDIASKAAVANSGAVDPTIVTDINSLKSNLDQIHIDYTNANSAGATALSHQSAIKTIVDDEKTRLDAKKEKIDNAIDGQQRVVMLNDNYRQKYAQYNNVYVVVVITLVLIIAISMASKYFTFIPSFVFDILIIFIFAAALYICYLIFVDIRSRDKMDFNKLSTGMPKISTPAEIEASKALAASNGDLLGSINLNGCMMNSCCSDGTRWDETAGRCIPNCPVDQHWSATTSSCVANNCATGTTWNGTTCAANTFATMTVSYKLGEFNKIVSPNSPNEYIDYVPYN